MGITHVLRNIAQPCTETRKWSDSHLWNWAQPFREGNPNCEKCCNEMLLLKCLCNSKGFVVVSSPVGDQVHQQTIQWIRQNFLGFTIVQTKCKYTYNMPACTPLVDTDYYNGKLHTTLCNWAAECVTCPTMQSATACLQLSLPLVEEHEFQQ